MAYKNDKYTDPAVTAMLGALSEAQIAKWIWLCNDPKFYDIGKTLDDMEAIYGLTDTSTHEYWSVVIPKVLGKYPNPDENHTIKEAIDIKRIESDAQSMVMSKDEIAKWDELMVCSDRLSLEDLFDNIMITEERMGITDRMLPDYWKYVARYVLSLYDNEAIGDRYKRLDKFKSEYDNIRKSIKVDKSTFEDMLETKRKNKEMDNNITTLYSTEDRSFIQDLHKKGTFEEGLAAHGFSEPNGIDAVEELSKILQKEISGEARPTSGTYYMQTVPDSHSFSDLAQIKESLRHLKIGYVTAPLPKDGNMRIEWPPISIEHMQKGIDNTIANGYKMVLQSELDNNAVSEEENRQINEWLDDLNVPKKEMGKNGAAYSIVGRVMQLLQMVQSNFQGINDSGLI